MHAGSFRDRPEASVRDGSARAFIGPVFPKALIPPRLIDGAHVIVALGIGQGPVVGRILQAVRAEQLAGNISTAEEALAFARTMFAGEK